MDIAIRMGDSVFVDGELSGGVGLCMSFGDILISVYARWGGELESLSTLRLGGIQCQCLLPCGVLLIWFKQVTVGLLTVLRCGSLWYCKFLVDGPYCMFLGFDIVLIDLKEGMWCPFGVHRWRDKNIK